MRAGPAIRRGRHGGALRAVLAALVMTLGAVVMTPALSQTLPGGEDTALPGILVLNQERLFARSLFGQRIQRELEESSARLAAENRRIEAELTAEELELTQLRETTEPTEFREMADAFDTRVEAIRAAQEAKARSLTEQADAAQAQFFEQVAPILLDIVRDRGAAVLMDSRAVLLSSDRVDVTETAIAAIDDALGEGGEDPIISIDIAPGTDPEQGSAP
jgi:Skp family chaperone for outer membrane proteins